MLKRHLEHIHCTPCVSDHLPVTLYFCWAKGICGLPPNWVTAEIVMSNILCYSYQESLILRLLLSTCVSIAKGLMTPKMSHSINSCSGCWGWACCWPAGRTLMSVTGLLAMEEPGTFSSSGNWTRGFEPLGNQNEGRGFPKEPKMSVSKLNSNGLSSSTRWLQKPWPNFP